MSPVEAMDLIIKPTQACDFACTFCSSTEISLEKTSQLDTARVFEFLERFPNTQTIIVNGGEPLIMGPEYYFEILDFIEKKGLSTTLSLTSNLWSFYRDPERWRALFRHPKVGVCTSFQFGSSRRISKNRVFTLEDFLKVSDLMLEVAGYRPDFISVVDDASKETALENVRLAKQLGVECKLNYAMASGRQSQPYLLAKIYSLYYRVWKEGLAPWEFNTRQLVEKAEYSRPTSCPRLKNCDAHIRALNPEGDYYSCGSLADDRVYEINWNEEMSGGLERPLQQDINLMSLKAECFSCDFFELCNGCKKTIGDLKSRDLVSDHCAQMKSQAANLYEMGLGRAD